MFLRLVTWKAATLAVFCWKAGLVNEVRMGRALDTGEAEVAKRRCALHAWRKIAGRRTDAIVRMEDWLLTRRGEYSKIEFVIREA